MFSRPRKLPHFDTIRYEVDMLDYCYKRLTREKWAKTCQRYLILEGFLLHYRNLIEFFADHGDLKVSDWKVWSPNGRNPNLASLKTTTPYKRHRSLISQYLQHCTKNRATRDQEWNVAGMYAELKTSLDKFKRPFPTKPVAAPVFLRAGKHVSTHSGSTATITTHDSGLNLTAPAIPIEPKPRGRK